ncbi:hypothetical protein [Carboxylicivirga caseinilyticus]|uniref:hypothetical protein n=1 Tax=Carboxylicivirga caseinilyticus TaxID=3417572 RepID=UPI003D32F54C|nr:hypothetical protein [Marinilabiliaceae bacterium A049]
MEFELSIGEENSRTLTMLVNDFEENYLAKHYGDIDMKKAYKMFLVDIKDYNIKERIQARFELVDKIKKSGFYEELYAINDSVWYDKSENIYHLRTKSLLPNGEYKIGKHEISYGRSAKTNIEETIKKHYSFKNRNFNSKFWNALKNIGEKEQYIYEYIDNTEAMGSAVAFALANGFLNSHLDYSDYFVKRIIVTEFVEY